MTVPELAEPAAKEYRCGSLRYTKRGLVLLFAWMLWGDFCFTLMEMVVPSILPLKLRSLGAANWIVAAIMSTLPGIFNTTICPWVSFKSDRHRGKLGRRIPFILYTLPFLSASLILIGLGDDIGGWIHRWFFSGGAVTQATVVVFLLAIFAALFDLFNMFVASVYWGLFNDVIPEQFMGRFMGWFRMVGLACSALYNYFIFPYALSHMREIYIGTALLYFVSFGLMCLRVKEREHPAPADAGLAPSIIRDIKTFAKECFSIGHYWNYFLNTTFSAIGRTILVFAIFFNQSIGLDLAMIGKIAAVGGVVGTVCYSFVGVLVDRWNPVRVMAYSRAFMVCLALSDTVWLFVATPSPTLVFWASIVFIGFTAVWGATNGASELPAQMILFPQEQYLAFCGAAALVRSAGIMVGGLAAGFYLDFVKQFYPPGDLFPYRYIHIWIFVFLVVAFCFHYRVFRYWKRLGGETGYVPPTTNIRYADLPKAENTGVCRGLLLLIGIAFTGNILVNAGYIYYFQFIAHRPDSAKVFGVYTGIMAIVMMAYLRFIRFMERA